MARVGGKYAVVGQLTDYGPKPINPSLITRKALRLAGVTGPYLRCIVRSFQYMHSVVRSPVEKLITHRYPLDEINEGFRAHESLDAMVAVVVPNQ